MLGNAIPSSDTLDFMVGWTCHETKTNSGAAFNLLNSEHTAPGSTNYNPNGVQNYVSYAQGIQMTVVTLHDGNYPSLIEALKNNTVDLSNSTILTNLNTWCGGCGYGKGFIALGSQHRNDTFGGSMTDYKGAIWIGNNNFFPDSGKKKFIILHGTAGGSSAQGIASYFRSTEGGNNPVSSHYVIGQDGAIVQTVAEKDGAWANGIVTNSSWGGNPNTYTISIEHVKAST